MLNKLKNIWDKVLVVFGVVILFLLYLLKNKDNKINSLKAEIDLVDTEQQADELRNKISKLKETDNTLLSEQQELDRLLLELDNKRKNLTKNKLTDKQKEDFWNE